MTDGDRRLLLWLNTESRVRTNEGRVIGNYFRYEQGAKAAIRDLIDHVTAFYEKKECEHSLLVWGPSGIGKTFLFSEIVRAVPEKFKAKLVTINGANETQTAVASKLKALRCDPSLVLCLIDEIDSPNHREWFCSEVFTSLDGEADKTGAQILYVVAGSHLGGIEAMKRTLSSVEYPKGCDLLTRISTNNSNHSIPDLTNREKALLFGQQCLAARGNPPAGLDVDALALYYIGAERAENPRPFETIRSISKLAQQTSDHCEGHHFIRWTKLLDDEQVIKFFMARSDIFKALNSKSLHFACD
jgi:hypothetical protein